MMEEEDESPSVNFIPCVTWVRRGVAQARPPKVELTKQELDDVIRQTRASLHVHDDDDSGTENDDTAVEIKEEPTGEIKQEPTEEGVNMEDEYAMDAYDEEDETQRPKIGDVAEVEGEDGYVEAEEDSDDEDDVIKPTDNLIVVGHVEGDASVLEVYVHNEDEGSLYVHHDILLPSIPLAVEWLNYDPENVHVASNLCAVGSMDPVIQVWDLDLINCIEPAYKLGRKGSRKKGIAAVGHTDAVLDLSWNTNLTHILASGSVDQKVLLWDLETKTPNTELKGFKEKVQSIMWHSSESHSLLTGSADKIVRVWDCRSSTNKSWTVQGEVERVHWCNTNDSRFVACDDLGNVYLMDVRQDAPLWSHKVDEKTITGLHCSSTVPGLMMTVSESGSIKIWDIQDTPALVMEKVVKVGAVQCADVAPESPFTIAVGGDNRSHNLAVQSFADKEAVKNRFIGRTNAPLPTIEGLPVPGPSAPSRGVKVREKRPRSTERSLNAKKKPKKLSKKNS